MSNSGTGQLPILPIGGDAHGYIFTLHIPVVKYNTLLGGFTFKLNAQNEIISDTSV